MPKSSISKGIVPHTASCDFLFPPWGEMNKRLFIRDRALVTEQRNSLSQAQVCKPMSLLGFPTGVQVTQKASLIMVQPVMGDSHLCSLLPTGGQLPGRYTFPQPLFTAVAKIRGAWEPCNFKSVLSPPSVGGNISVQIIRPAVISKTAFCSCGSH